MLTSAGRSPPFASAQRAVRAPVLISKIEVNRAGKAAKYGLNLVRVNADWCKLWVHPPFGIERL